jgi:hypothetical protein
MMQLTVRMRVFRQSCFEYEIEREITMRLENIPAAVRSGTEVLEKWRYGPIDASVRGEHDSLLGDLKQ